MSRPWQPLRHSSTQTRKAPQEFPRQKEKPLLYTTSKTEDELINLFPLILF